MSDIEVRILSRLTSPEAMLELWEEGVRAEVFEEPLYQSVWNFTEEYWNKAKRQSVPTEWAIAHEFPGFTRAAPAEDELAYLAQVIRQRHVSNKVQHMLMEAVSTTMSDPLGTLKQLHAAAYAVSETVAPRRTRVNMAETIAERRERYARVEEFPQGIGVPYGLDALDLHTGGLQAGELAVLGAFAKTGKTMFGLHVAAKIVRQGYRPIVYTLEMGLKEIETRLDAMFSGVSYNKLVHATLDKAELAQLHEGQEELASLGGIQIEMPPEEDRTVAALMARTRQYGADWCFIDQLSFMNPGQKTQTLKEHHGTIVKQLKTDVSRAGSEVACLLAAQFKRGEEEISMESFSNATEIEANADILLGLTRNRDLRNNSLMECRILGSRRSDNANYLLTWELTKKTEITVQSEIRTGL